jgi:chromosomal replication initiation ATPase DnaA
MQALLNKQSGIYWVVGKQGWKGTGLGNWLKTEALKLGKKVCPVGFAQFFHFWLQAAIERNILAMRAMQRFLSSFDVVIFEDVDILLSGKPATREELKNFLKDVVKKNTQILLLCDKKPA